MVVHEDPVAESKAAHLLSCGHDGSGGFVAENERGLGPDVPVHHVPGADAAGAHPDQDLPGSDGRNRPLLDADIVEIVDHGRGHGFGKGERHFLIL